MDWSCKIGIVLLIFISVETVSGQESTEAEFINQIAKTKEQIRSITCQFEQTLALSVLLEEQKSSGNFFYRTPGQLKWEQQNPEIYTLVINGDESYKLEGEERKELAAGGMQVVGFKRFILGTMDGSIFNSDHFETNVMKQNGDWQVEMIPQKKSLSRRFEKISLTFDQQKMLLRQMVFSEAGGDTRAIQFLNHQINTLTDDSNFQ